MSATDLITLGVGPEGDIPSMTLVGLQPNPEGEPPPSVTEGDLVFANSGSSGMSGGCDDLDIG